MNAAVFKHTPGPWSVSSNRGSVGAIACDTGFVAFPTCDPRQIDETRNAGESWLEMRERTDVERDALKAEASANARLIAAAPELLEALKAICDEQDANEGYATPATYDAARAAIAKAIGAA